MAKQRRRVFLKVIAVGPLVGCAGADPEGPHGGSGGETDTGGDGGGAGGKSSVGGGGSTKPVVSGGTSSSSGGNPFVNGGANPGGNPFASAGGNPSAGGTTASGGGSSANSDGTTTPIIQGTFVGNVTAFPVGWFGIAGSLFFLGRDAAGIYAMSMQCTHQFCALVMSGNELDCPCHKSRFDRSGNVLQGPAVTPLPYYKVFIDGAGNVSVDKYAVVSRNARTPV